jgi:large subunit ribosomal protein L1
MPNPKLGTVTANVRDAVLAAKRGQAEFRAEKRGIVATGVGKVSFPAADLRENVRALMLALSEQKPEGMKGAYMRSATLSSTMGPGIPLDVAYIDPASPHFMAPVPQPGAASGAAAAVGSAAGGAGTGGSNAAAAAAQ